VASNKSFKNPSLYLLSKTSKNRYLLKRTKMATFFGLFAETEDALTQDKLETKSDLSVYSIEDED